MQEGTLSINGVRAEDRGYFICSALSAAGSLSAKAHLEVLGSGEKNAPPPPVIDLGPANQTLPLDTIAILPCRASGGAYFLPASTAGHWPWASQSQASSGYPALLGFWGGGGGYNFYVNMKCIN